MAVARRAAEAKDNHVGTKAADHPHHVAQDFLAAPFLESFLRSLSESEVDSAGEKLLRAVDTPGCQQLLRADHSQGIALFSANQILAAFAASERKIAGPNFAAARQVGEQRGVLVVGMRRDHQNAPHHVQPVEVEARLRRSR